MTVLSHVIAVLGLGVLCGLWVVVQRWIAAKDPGMRGVEDRCGSCAVDECEDRE